MSGKSPILNVAGRKIGEGHPAYVIAEIGFNHEGKISLAKEMISAAKEAGADAAKLQTYLARDLTLKNHPHYELIVHGELDLDAHLEMAEHARSEGITFLSTPFSLDAVDLLEEVGVPAYKVASMDVTHHPMLAHIAATRKPVFLSTGMATAAEIEAALAVLEKADAGDIALLHCVSHYPPEIADANIRSMSVLREKFGRVTGYSDHVLGPIATLAAVARGASVIEKHFTTDKNLPGPDHKISANTDDLKALITDIRAVEAALGRACLDETRPDRGQANASRRGIYANGDVKKGDPFTKDNLKIVRPESNLPPSAAGQFYGHTSNHYLADEAPLEKETK